MRYPRRPRDRVVEYFETVKVVPLPAGWRNWFRSEDGRIFAEPAPALLLQECRQWVECWDAPGPDGTTRTVDRDHDLDPPFQTQVMVASLDGGWLQPVDEIGNYVMTTGPGQVPKLDVVNRDLSPASAGRRRA